MDKTTIGLIVIAIAVFGGIIGATTYSNKNFQARNMCVEHSAGLGMHIHPTVAILIDGQSVTIPANIGIDPTCMKAVHTHDASGEIHLEYPEQHDFTLGDFFTVWGQNFSQNQIMDKQVDDQHTITVTSDGQPTNEYEKLILKDKQQIVITYSAK